MAITFTDLNQQSSPTLRKRTVEKLNKLFKLANNTITSIQVTFDVDKLRHIAEANVQLKGTSIHAKSESEYMYKTVDLLVDKLARQLTKHKEKITGRR